VKSIFLAAVALADPPARAALVKDRCGADAELLRRVEALLAAHDRAADEGRTASAAAPPNPTADYPGRDETVGAVLGGKYKLVEAIGEGGMGSVYMAQQTEPVKRAVAVKVVKAGMDTKAVLARFEAERQALALMDHPNIARVLDAGSTAGGRPFFVMELVKGVPITQFCDDRKLTPRQRLELFVPVCHALQHAHQKGVIHRDVKPSNVLVALYDDRPVPKVIDFGVAKAAGQTLTDKTLMTGFGAVAGTPEYMSPEQASLNNLDIDTRSDVYSLGVLLYELLTGSTPVDRKSLGRAALLEVLRIVREVEAPRPSAKLSTSDALPSVAANRGTEPAKLSKLMRGELDWLVLKALEKDRARRYESANGLARDVQRYLADEIVEARPPSAGYRVRKFVRRHKTQVLAAGLVLAALLAGIAGTTVGLIRATRAAEAERLAKLDAEEQRANAERAAGRETAERTKAEAAREQEALQRKLAQTNEAEANAVERFLRDNVFALAEPKGQRGRPGKDVTLRDAIVASVPALETEFQDQPLVEARLRRTLAGTFKYLGEFESAREQDERALAIHKRVLGPDHPHTLSSMNNLVVSYAILKRHADALKLGEEALAAQRRVLPPDHPDTLRSMNNLANSYAALKRHADALKLRE
jgi:serine/threonine protein kinase